MTLSGARLRKAMCSIAVVLVSGLAVGAVAIQAVEARSVPADQPTVALTTLPIQAQRTYRLILDGGPFPYTKDGSVFGNRERQLPPRARGYYREYTVKTPHATDRGARRIICVGVPQTLPAACFYTDDHYASFRRIKP
jgi:ribonuclease T1